MDVSNALKFPWRVDCSDTASSRTTWPSADNNSASPPHSLLSAVDTNLEPVSAAVCAENCFRASSDHDEFSKRLVADNSDHCCKAVSERDEIFLSYKQQQTCFLPQKLSSEQKSEKLLDLSHSHHQHTGGSTINKELQEMAKMAESLSDCYASHDSNNGVPKSINNSKLNRSPADNDSAAKASMHDCPSDSSSVTGDFFGSLSNMMQKSPLDGTLVSSNVLRPKSGRAKTNAELKKQLMERREQQRLRDQFASDSSTFSSNASCNGSSNGLESNISLGQSSKWTVGDMLWSKVSGHPWWPCMICPDPNQSIHTKLIPRGQKGMLRQYHVIFFGDESERGWIQETSAFVYAGRAAFDQFAQTASVQSNSREKKNFVIAPNRRRSWELAVSSAEHAMSMSREQRLNEFVHVSSSSTIGSANSKLSDRLTLEAVDDSDTGRSKFHYEQQTNIDALTASAIKRRNSGSGVSVDDEIYRAKFSRTDSHPTESDDAISPRKDIVEAQFAVFCRSRRKVLIRDHPEYTADEIDQRLVQEWSQTDSVTRQKYIPMLSESSLSTSLKNLKSHKGNGKINSRRNSEPCSSRLQNTEKSTKALSPTVFKRRGRPSRDTSGNVVTATSMQVSLASSEQNVVGLEQGTAGASGCTTYPRWDIGVESEWKTIDICRVCERPCSCVPAVRCTGICQAVYHSACLPSSSNDVAHFMCEECRTGAVCFKCKLTSRGSHKMKRCSVTSCGRFYHDDCIGSSPECGLHSCSACKAAESVGRQTTPYDDSKGMTILCQCVRCPSAFHMSYLCLAAGSQFIGGTSLICSRHHVPAKVHSHISTTWCLTCDRGGSLLHCNICPASYHAACVNSSSVPAPVVSVPWTCPSCQYGRRPVYGEFVWVKYSNYRWWPGQICYPETVPLNIRELPHDVGQFAVYFFGTRDYLWTHQARVLPYRGQEGGYLEQPTASKSLAKVFQKALKEVREAYRIWHEAPGASAANNSLSTAENVTTKVRRASDIGSGRTKKTKVKTPSRRHSAAAAAAAAAATINAAVEPASDLLKQSDRSLGNIVERTDEPCSLDKGVKDVASPASSSSTVENGNYLFDSDDDRSPQLVIDIPN